MAEVRDVLREVRLTIGSEGDSGERERQQARVKRMLLAMGVPEEELDTELREYKQQQEAAADAAAAASQARQPNGEAHVGVPEAAPQQEWTGAKGPSQSGELGTADMEMDVDEGPTGMSPKDLSTTQVGSGLCPLSQVVSFGHNLGQRPVAEAPL